MAKFCADCGTAIEAGEKFCSGCGKALTVMPLPAPTEQPAPEQAKQDQRIQPMEQEQTPQTQAVQQPYIQPSPAAVRQPMPAVAAETNPISAIKYWSWLFIMTLPLAGLAVSILWGKNKEPSDRRSLARAMVFYSAVWLIFCIAFAVTLNLFLQAKDLVNIDFKLFGIKLF